MRVRACAQVRACARVYAMDGMWESKIDIYDRVGKIPQMEARAAPLS